MSQGTLNLQKNAPRHRRENEAHSNKEEKHTPNPTNQDFQTPPHKIILQGYGSVSREKHTHTLTKSIFWEGSENLDFVGVGVLFSPFIDGDTIQIRSGSAIFNHSTTSKAGSR